MKWTRKGKHYGAEYLKESEDDGVAAYGFIFRHGRNNWKWTADAHCIMRIGQRRTKIALHAVKAEGKGYSMKDAKTQAETATQCVYLLQKVLRDERRGTL